MKKIYILIAPQCSGKSTWVKNNSSYMNNPYIASTDDIIVSTYPELSYNEAFKKISFKEVERRMIDELNDAIKNNRDIIVDRTNMSVKSRKRFLSMVDENYIKVAVVLPWDRDTFLERNEKRNINENKFIPLRLWEDFCSKYEKPTYDEGFDEIIFL